MSRKTAVALIINNRDEFLLQKKSLDYENFPGKWAFFGGGVDNGELPSECIKRELKEELGVDFSHVTFFMKHNWRFGGLYFEDYVFIVRFDKKPSDLSLFEGAGFAFFGEQELFSLDLIENARFITDKYSEINFKNTCL